MTKIIDSYSETNNDTDRAMQGVGTGVGAGAFAQAFTVSADATLGSVRWYLKKTLAPTESLLAKVYNISGTYGTNAIPAGAALATSDPVPSSSLTTSYSFATFTFSGANQLLLTAATANYAVSVERFIADATNFVSVGSDFSSPTHSGNLAQFNSSAWSAPSAADLIFYLQDNTHQPLMLNNYQQLKVDDGMSTGEKIR